MLSQLELTCNNDNYSDWWNTCWMRCQPAGPTALWRAEFYCFLHGNCFSPALFCSLLTSLWNESLQFPLGPSTFLQNWSHGFLGNSISRLSNHFLNGNQMTTLTPFLGQFINVISIKVLTERKEVAQTDFVSMLRTEVELFQDARIPSWAVSKPLDSWLGGLSLLSCW